MELCSFPPDIPPETVRAITDLRKIITIADRTRSAVRASKKGEGSIKMEREISLRGTDEATRFYSQKRLWERNFDGSKENAAQYTIRKTYIPHTNTYKRGKIDEEAILNILAEGISA